MGLNPEPTSMTGDRDPRTYPQPGDELRGSGIIRRVILRDGDMLICESWQRRYRVRVYRPRAWYEKSGAEAGAAVNQDG